ncbi:hypothetical protein VAPA_2c05470 [Variovorax paradoxus B4]|uniref:Uncharacterized protein n=1 Tax=Variovorax paradoxus B4 TaxID=1246301 RepID=T1XJT2_VARPD|nr:hypothetical protein VAPA_2c05470 [Variovorax paradoxus B4]
MGDLISQLRAIAPFTSQATQAHIIKRPGRDAVVRLVFSAFGVMRKHVRPFRGFPPKGRCLRRSGAGGPVERGRAHGFSTSSSSCSIPLGTKVTP